VLDPRRARLARFRGNVGAASRTLISRMSPSRKTRFSSHPLDLAENFPWSPSSKQGAPVILEDRFALALVHGCQRGGGYKTSDPRSPQSVRPRPTFLLSGAPGGAPSAPEPMAGPRRCPLGRNRAAASTTSARGMWDQGAGSPPRRADKMPLAFRRRRRAPESWQTPAFSVPPWPRQRPASTSAVLTLID